MGGRKSKPGYVDNPVNQLEPVKSIPPSPLMVLYDPRYSNLENASLDVFDDPTSRVEKDDVNYGRIPLEIIHNVLLFLELKDLSVMIRTCRLFNVAGNSNYFWKSYFINTYGSLDQEETHEEQQGENWKKIFYKRSYLFNDEFYKKKYEKVAKGGDEKYSTILKIMVSGPSGSGKSKFIYRYVHDYYDDDFLSTIGCDFFIQDVKYEVKKKKGVDQRKNTHHIVRLQIWDLAGQERFRTIIHSTYRNAKVILLFFSLNSKEQFRNLKFYYEEVREVLIGFGEYKDDENSNTNLRFVLVGSKCDLVDKDEEDVGEEGKKDQKSRREVFYEPDILEFLKDKPMMRYVEVSAKEDINVCKAMGMAIDGAIDFVKKTGKMFC